MYVAMIFNKVLYPDPKPKRSHLKFKKRVKGLFYLKNNNNEIIDSLKTAVDLKHQTDVQSRKF